MGPFIGQIIMFAGNFAPRGWAFCNGQHLPISSNAALFSILGMTYGGNGRTTFALPDLRGRAAVHPGTAIGVKSIKLGEKDGQSDVALTLQEMPSHGHTASGTARCQSAGASTNQPQANIWGRVESSIPAYSNQPPDTTMVADSVNVTVNAVGGSWPHNNMQPYLGINFIIALQGIFPPHS